MQLFKPETCQLPWAPQENSKKKPVYPGGTIAVFKQCIIPTLWFCQKVIACYVFITLLFLFIVALWQSTILHFAMIPVILQLSLSRASPLADGKQLSVVFGYGLYGALNTTLGVHSQDVVWRQSTIGNRCFLVRSSSNSYRCYLSSPFGS